MMKTIKDFNNTEDAIKHEFNVDIKGIPTKEQETIINYTRNGTEAVIHTSDQTVITKLCKLNSIKITDYWTNKGSESVYQVTGNIQKRLISFRNQH